jgi:hypothetical protein
MYGRKPRGQLHSKYPNLLMHEAGAVPQAFNSSHSSMSKQTPSLAANLE